jgi:hypothetical protein
VTFKKGESGNPDGRPAGQPNKATAEMKELARQWTTQDPEWVESARQRMKEGKAPHLETYLLGMGHGTPKKEHEVTVKKPKELESMTETELGQLESLLEIARQRAESGDAVH